MKSDLSTTHVFLAVFLAQLVLFSACRACCTSRYTITVKKPKKHT